MMKISNLFAVDKLRFLKAVQSSESLKYITGVSGCSSNGSQGHIWPYASEGYPRKAENIALEVYN